MSFATSREYDIKAIYKDFVNKTSDNIKKKIDDDLEFILSRNSPQGAEVETTGVVVNKIWEVFEKEIERYYFPFPNEGKCLKFHPQIRISVRYVNKSTQENTIGSDFVIFFEVLDINKENDPLISKTTFVQAKSNKSIINKIFDFFSIDRRDLKDQIRKMRKFSPKNSFVCVYDKNGAYFSNAEKYKKLDKYEKIEKKEFLSAGEVVKKVFICEIGDQGICSPKNLDAKRVNGYVDMSDFFEKLIAIDKKKLTPLKKEDVSIYSITLEPYFVNM